MALLKNSSNHNIYSSITIQDKVLPGTNYKQTPGAKKSVPEEGQTRRKIKAYSNDCLMISELYLYCQAQPKPQLKASRD